MLNAPMLIYLTKQLVEKKSGNAEKKNDGVCMGCKIIQNVILEGEAPRYMQCIISHTGIMGMHWGIRRYQNEDGSLTPAGKARYAKTGEYGYHYKSRFTKHAEKRIAKYGQKAKEAMAKGDTKKAEKFKEKEKYNRAFAKYNAKIDKRMQEYAAKATLGQRLLTGKRRLTIYAISDIKPTDPLYKRAMAVTNANIREYGLVSVYDTPAQTQYRQFGSTSLTRYAGFERERERH